MNPSKTRREMAALRDAALEDLMATTDAQLRLEATEDGEDFAAVAGQIHMSMRDAAAAALRQRLTEAKDRMKSQLAAPTKPISRPPLDQLKQIVQDIFKADQSLGLAFRDGKKQSDTDWLSLYDELVAMGAIKPDDHGC